MRGVAVAILIIVVCVSFTTAHAAVVYPLSVSGNNIVDSRGDVVQLRCINWPAHMSTLVIEGVQWRSINEIVQTIVSANAFNCVRLLYSVELVLAPRNLTVRSRLTNLNLNQAIRDIEKHNSHILDAQVLDALELVVSALNDAGLMVLADNTMSVAGWCCSYTDDNGWWNDGVFNVPQWIASLEILSSRLRRYPNVIAFAMRNEPRSLKPYEQQISEWYHYMPMGIRALHAAHPTALIFVSSPGYDTSFAFFNTMPIPTNWTELTKQVISRLVYEAHAYSFSGYGNYTQDCKQVYIAYNNNWGFLKNNKNYHFPLILTEIGINIEIYPNYEIDYLFFHCIINYIKENNLGYGLWWIGGTEMFRDTQYNYLDNYGLLNKNWSNWSNLKVLHILQNLSTINNSNIQTIKKPYTTII